MDNVDAILRKCFDFRAPPSTSLVVGKFFSSVKVESSNAALSNRFSDASIEYETGWQVPLDWFWCDAIVKIVENYCGDKKSDNLSRDRAVTRLLTFLGDDCNAKHLKKVKHVKTEAEIQAILAHHLFVHLAPSAEYVMDGNHWPSKNEKRCPACSSDLKFGNTSIGHHKVWYGFPDIFVNRTTVKIEMNQDEEETEKYEWNEPATKKFKVTNDIESDNEINIGAGGEGSDSIQDVFTTSIEVKKDSVFNSEKAVQQALAQTITNAFYQTKQNQKLRDLCIPSFLISDAKLKIIMYNVEQDMLYMSVDMALWNSDGNLNVGTMVCLWLALNYENFQNHVKEDDLGAIGIEKSTFQAELPKNILSIYENELMKCLPLRRKKTSDPPTFTVYNSRLLSSKYAQSVHNKLQSMVNVYFT